MYRNHNHEALEYLKYNFRWAKLHIWLQCH